MNRELRSALESSPEGRAYIDAKAKAKRSRALRVAPKRGTAPGKSIDAKKDAERARLEVLAQIRIDLHAETGGRCVVCGLGLPFARMHAHHILGGPERKAEERKETMAPVHERCHDWLHGKDARFDQREALLRLQAWCLDTGRDVAAASVQRRIAKIDEVRAHAY